jgi:hypothetical protein
MPRIRDEFLECVVYLYPSRRAAQKGEQIGGSGFLVSVKRTETSGWLYAVTNDHVISGGASVIRINTAYGDAGIFEIPPSNWIRHPKKDDLAVCQLSGFDPGNYKFITIPTALFMRQDLLQQTGIGPGDDTYLIGRFINHEGKQKNLPTVRQGIISMMPEEKFQTPSHGMRERFLVEVKSIGGYSGSPVVVSIPAIRQSTPFMTPLGGPAPTAEYLLGVDCGHILNKEPVFLIDKKSGKPMKTDYEAQSNTGMALVIPAWEILEILQCEQLTKQREQDIETSESEKETASDTKKE